MNRHLVVVGRPARCTQSGLPTFKGAVTARTLPPSSVLERLGATQYRCPLRTAGGPVATFDRVQALFAGVAVRAASKVLKQLNESPLQRLAGA